MVCALLDFSSGHRSSSGCALLHFLARLQGGMRSTLIVLPPAATQLGSATQVRGWWS